MKALLKNSPAPIDITHVVINSKGEIQGYYSRHKQIYKEDILRVFDDIEQEFSEIWI